MPGIKKFVEVPGVNDFAETNPKSFKDFTGSIENEVQETVTKSIYAELKERCPAKNIDAEWFPLTIDKIKVYFSN